MTKTCSTHEAAKILGVSHRTIQLWVEAGQLRAWRTVGGHRRIFVSSIDEIMTTRSSQHTYSTNSKNQVRSSLTRPTAFICESDPTLRELFRRCIIDWDGVEWKFFKSNIQALLEIGAKRPEILISEISASGLDVLHMTRTLLNHPTSHNMKIILTSDLTESTLMRLNFPPQIRILKKPFSYNEFAAEISSLLTEIQSGGNKHPL